MIGAAFGRVPERLGHPALRRDRPDLSPQFCAVNGQPRGATQNMKIVRSAAVLPA